MPVFAPKLVTTLREGYDLRALRADAVAGLTVAIVALPLSMAIAIASHALPQAGLYAAIVGGFLVSALGGSRFQIGGPAGAFIVLIASIINLHGFGGLLLATMMAGVMILLAGLCRLGNLIRRVPHEVVQGFTAGIGVIILASQASDFLGLRGTGVEPGPLMDKTRYLLAALGSLSLATTALSCATVMIIYGVRHARPHWPALLIAVSMASILAYFVNLPVETIGDRFGAMPRGLPWPMLPEMSLERIVTLLPAAASLAVLGAIESLLSAVVADTMTGRQHRPNTELVAQGIANIITPMFGGITVTGTIARTATNVKSKARGPISGMLHAVFILLFLLLAAPLLAHVPLAALAGVLVVVALGMVDWRMIWTSGRWQVLSVILVTFLVTIFRDLLQGIAAGLLLHFVLNRPVRP
jgi:sulfate permease, SulP family